MIRRFELTDKQSAAIADLVARPWQARRTLERPSHHAQGHPFGGSTPKRNGARCPSVTPRPRASMIGFNFWRADGTLDRILERLHLKLTEEGRLDVALWCVDATSIRASRSAAGAARGKPGPFAWRLGHQGTSRRRWPQHPPGCDHHRRSGAREQTPGRHARSGAPAQRQRSADLPARKTGG